MRHLHVLFAGCPNAGRRTSLAKLTGAAPEIGTIFPDEGTAEVRTSSGEVLMLHGRVPDFGSLWFETWEEILTAEHEWCRVAARTLFEFLPKIDGIVFVANACRLPATVRALHRLERDLSRIGIDLRQIPVVFQHNMRDRSAAAPIEEMMAALSTPRCAHVESVAVAGQGVQRAFDTLVRMIDDPAAPPVPPAPTPEVRARSLRSPPDLFGEVISLLTCDGDVRAAIQVTTEATGIELGHAAVLLGWPKKPTTEHDFVEGAYSVDIAVRRAHVRVGGEWLSGQRRIVGARVHLPGAEVVRREPIFDGHTYTDFIFLGAPEEVAAVEQDRVSQDAYVRADERGAAPLARVDDRFELAERGGTVLLRVGTWNEAHVLVGFDRDSRAVELLCWGDDGAAMLARGAP
jgi:hypothetical protein